MFRADEYKIPAQQQAGNRCALFYDILQDYISLLIFGLLVSCSDASDSDSLESSAQDNTVNENSSDENGCKFDDGTHSATVDYYNSATGYSQTYTLDVEVQNCEVVQINFPRGGWLDSDHISPAELNEEGHCTIYGEDGKTYEIQIDN